MSKFILKTTERRYTFKQFPKHSHTKAKYHNCSFQRVDGVKCPGYLIQHDASKKMPGVVVLQEWWGVNDQIAGIAEKIAEAGFVTLVPDIYRGEVCDTAKEASHHMGDLDWVDAAKDVEAAANYLKNELQCPSVGTVGFCVGGALVIIAASKQVPSLSAAVCYYGYIPDDSLGDPSKIKIPIQCQFALKDHCTGFADVPTANLLEAKLKKGNVPHEFIRYNTGHSFLNEDYFLRQSAKYPEPYDPEIAKESLERTIAFFKTHLKV